MQHEALEAAVYQRLLVAIAEEMGVTLERTAFSPNIKERRDHSCALFDAEGRLIAQAAHIPVHLGAFPVMMRRLVDAFPWEPGDVVLCNDPDWGGTHLPDISLISPVFFRGERVGFVANRAHHADVGGTFPGSMGPSTEVYQEGLVVPPLHLFRAGERVHAVEALLLRNTRTPRERSGDLAAQIAAVRCGEERLQALCERFTPALQRRLSERLITATRDSLSAFLSRLPEGRVRFVDFLEPLRAHEPPLRVECALEARDGRLVADFTGTDPQVAAPINATLAVTTSAVLYVLLCLVPEIHPNEGVVQSARIHAPAGTLVNAGSGAAVAAGNVETSQRITDVLLGAVSQLLPGRTPAASQGSMNNVTLGGERLQETGSGRAERWAYYETLGGGSGAGPTRGGVSGIHCHMSNTRNTPAEALEYHYPLRLRRYGLREGSGGAGRHEGGMGVIRETELLAPATLSLLTDRRGTSPYGLEGGGAGEVGRNTLVTAEGEEPLPARCSRSLPAGSVLRMETPGGGGWGSTWEEGA